MVQTALQQGAVVGFGLASALRGQPQLVRLEAPGGTTLVQFDAVMSETYTYAAQPTAFPIEDGSTIADHLVHAPRQIDLVGIISDDKLGGNARLFQEAATVAATTLLPPLGVLGGSVAVSTWLADQNAQSPSLAAYQKLVRLCEGDQSGDGKAPTTFDVVTRLGRVKNCCIANLTVPRDVDTGQALIFNVTLVQLVVVTAQVINISALDNPALGAMRQSLAEQQTLDTTVGARGFNLGADQTHNLTGFRR